MKYFNLKSKIIATTLLCVFVLALSSNALLYHYFSGVILEKSTAIDTLNLKSVQTQIETRITAAYNLVANCISNDSVSALALYPSLETLEAQKAAFAVQDELALLRASSSVWTYIDKLIVFNTNGLIVQGHSNIAGSPIDYIQLTNSSFVQEALATNALGKIEITLSQSISWPYDLTLVAMAPIYTTTATDSTAYIYMEFDQSIFTDLLDPFEGTQELLVASDDAQHIITADNTDSTFHDLFADLKEGDTFVIEEKTCQLHTRALALCDLSLYTYTDLSIFDSIFTLLGFPVLVMIVTCMLLCVCLIFLLSTYITHPINRIIARIKHISENDFSYDPTIEKTNDEFGQIGRVINEMILSVDNLVHQTKEMSEHRKNIEINLLQSQVNPHFLYNTLDSVYWMAVIQKNPGIANMIRSLINLMKNISKGTDDKIPLREELDILKDYIQIQSVRYLETFAFTTDIPEALMDYTIVKLSLQPIVENAIFHGIEPTGKSGTIHLSAHETPTAIVLQVQDDGAGMSKEQCLALLAPKRDKTRSKTSMNGIGVSNVHTRLQLIYGKQYGLAVESEPTQGTTVSITIPKEKI